MTAKTTDVTTAFLPVRYSASAGGFFHRKCRGVECASGDGALVFRSSPSAEANLRIDKPCPRPAHRFSVTSADRFRLHREALTFQSGWQAVSIPLHSIRVLSRGDYPASAKPVPLGYLGVTYEEHGNLRTLLLTPASSGRLPPSEVNRLVVEWTAAVQEAVRRVTGRTLEVDTSNTAENWSWAELLKTFLLTAAGCTVAFMVIPLITSQRLPNRWEELVWGPLTAALTLGILLTARWSRRWMSIRSARQTCLRDWDRWWLRIPAPVRQVLRTAFLLAALVLACLFASYSYSERNHQDRVFYEWSVGAFDPWLRKSLQDSAASGCGTRLGWA